MNVKPKELHKSKQINVYLKDDTYEKVWNLSYKHNMSVSKIVRTMILRGLDCLEKGEDLDKWAK